jgi:hypothetical protein
LNKSTFADGSTLSTVREQLLIVNNRANLLCRSVRGINSSEGSNWSFSIPGETLSLMLKMIRSLLAPIAQWRSTAG